MHEAQMHEENSFITLTYNEQNLPKDGSVHLEHFQSFMKKLRKSLAPKKVRFYHCGEYGEINKRPHYHSLLFGHSFADRRFYSERNGNRVYTSELLSKLWTKGFSVVGDVTFESAAYVARYVMKKVTGERAKEYYGNRSPEYTTMSRRPGIGATWLEKFHSDVYPLDRVVVRGAHSRPPRFYDNQLGKTDPALLAWLKINRENDSVHFVDDVLSDGRHIKVSDSCDARLKVKELVKEAQIKTLIRPLED